MYRVLWMSILLLLSACSATRVSSVALPAQQKVALMPLVNYTQTPLAGQRAEDMLASLWFQQKLPTLLRYPRKAQGNLPSIDDQQRLDAAHAWLSHQSADYVLSGSIDEWRYKAGLDGEPTVSVTLQLVDKHTDKVIWSGTVAKTGWGRESVSSVGQKVIAQLISHIEGI
ncbi:protein PelC [Celerinatantimonas sp. MCCC 1A17872]|uniref:protein PelC n=1 Tax=Celerinatantimonas sp. MCCC 1A17872 TaxID=3177514 RepID=UPI0038C0B515